MALPSRAMASVLQAASTRDSCCGYECDRRRPEASHALRFFCACASGHQECLPQAGGRVRLKHESARDARNGLNISGNGEKYLCLERPVFDTHAFFLFVGSLHTRVHKRWPNVVAKRAGRQGLTKGSAIPACAVSNCGRAHTAARAGCSERGRKSKKRGGRHKTSSTRGDLSRCHRRKPVRPLRRPNR